MSPHFEIEGTGQDADCGFDHATHELGSDKIHQLAAEFAQSKGVTVVEVEDAFGPPCSKHPNRYSPAR